MKTWQEIYNGELYQKAPLEEQQAVQKDYFDKIIAPKVKQAGDDINLVWQDFTSKYPLQKPTAFQKYTSDYETQLRKERTSEIKKSPGAEFGEETVQLPGRWFKSESDVEGKNALNYDDPAQKKEIIDRMAKGEKFYLAPTPRFTEVPKKQSPEEYGIEEEITSPKDAAIVGATIATGGLLRGGITTGQIAKQVIGNITWGTSDIAEGVGKRIIGAISKKITKDITKEELGKIITNEIKSTVRKGDIPKDLETQVQSQINNIPDSYKNTQPLDDFSRFPNDIARQMRAGKLTPEQYNANPQLYDKAATEEFNKQLAPVIKTTQETQPVVDKVLNQFKKDEELIKKAEGLTWDKVKQVFTREVIDKEGNVKKTLLNEGAKDAVIKREIADRASSQAAFDMQQADNQIFKGMKKQEITDLNRIRESLRSIEVGKRGLKNPGGITAEEHEIFINSFKDSNPEYYNKLIGKSQEIDNVYTQLLKDKLDAGLISQESYDAIKVANDFYNPRHFIQHLNDNLGTLKPQYKGKTGVKALTTGSEEALLKDSRVLMQQSISETKSVIAKNLANQELYRVAQNNQESIVKVFKGENIPTGYKSVDVFNKGIKEQIIMPKDLADEWNGLDPLLNRNFANWLQILSGTKILKSFATGVNPVFALSNLPRDIAYIYLNSKEYSTLIPRYTAQMIHDLGVTFKDAVTKKGLYEKFVKEAGGMETLTSQSKLSVKHFQKVQEIAGAFGNFSERWTRLAHTYRGVQNGKSIQEAANYAIDLLDFGQGGRVTKAIDNIVPYFNAGIQGTRGTLRAAKENPERFVVKVANLASLSTGLYLYNHYANPETYEMIPPEIKSSNFVFTTGLNFKDKDGDIRYIYFTLPKDQSQRILSSGFEAAAKVLTGEAQDKKELEKSTRDFVNIFPEEGGYLSPIAKSVMGYGMNYDFYRKSKIWKKGDVKALDEWTSETPEALKKLGEVTGMSPDRSKYALQQFFTSNNFFTNLFSFGSKEISDAMKDVKKDWTLQEIQQAIPGLYKFMRITPKESPGTWEMIDEAKKEIGSKNINIKREIDKIFKEKDSSDIINYISSLPEEDIKSNLDYVVKLVKTEGIPNKQWYMNLQTLPASIKAKVFMNKYNKSSPDIQNKMLQVAAQVGGILNKSFIKEMENAADEKGRKN